MVFVGSIVIFSFLLVVLLFLVKTFISDFNISKFSREEVSSYECGFEQHSLARVPISVRYFLLTLVFLLFDLEIMLIMFSSFDMGLGVSKSYVIVFVLMFLVLLFLGLLFEWKDGALDWIM